MPVSPISSTRKSIRAAIVGQLIAAGTRAQDRVFSNRSEAWRHELDGGEFPAISVYSKDEAATIWNEAPREYERTAKIEIECLIDQQDLKQGDDELDDMLQEVEGALLDREGILHPSIERFVMTGTKVELSADGDRVVLAGTLNFDLVYHSGTDEAQGTLAEFVTADVTFEAPPPGSDFLAHSIIHPPTDPNGRAQYPKLLGTNMTHIAPHFARRLFVNCFKECAAWPTATVIDANGWPADIGSVGTHLWTGSQGKYLAGTYSVFAVGLVGDGGAGTITVQGDVGVPVTITASGQTFTVATPTDAGCLVTLVNTVAAPGNITAVEVIHSSNLSIRLTKRFDPLYVAFIQSVAKYVRFMDAYGTNLSQQIVWSDRPTPDWYTANSSQAAQPGTTARGISLEDIIDFCNEAGVDPWFNFPHRGDNTYAINAFTLFRDRLDPGRKVYIEVSNEVWNFGFAGIPPSDQGQYTYFKNLGTSLGLPGNPLQVRQEALKRRSIEIFTIAETVFGGTSRLVRILAGRMGGTLELKTMMDFEPEFNNQVDALSVATYFGGPVGNANPPPQGNPSGRKPLTLDDFFLDLTLCRATILAGWTTTFSGLLGYAKRMLPYEGGGAFKIQNKDGWAFDPVLQQLFNDAQNDPRMVGVYDEWMRDVNGFVKLFPGDGGQTHYGDLFTYTTHPTSARFCLKSFLEETPAPKYDNWARVFAL